MIVRQQQAEIRPEVCNMLKSTLDNLEFTICFHLSFSILLLTMFLWTIKSFNRHFSSEGGLRCKSLMRKLVVGAYFIHANWKGRWFLLC